MTYWKNILIAGCSQVSREEDNCFPMWTTLVKVAMSTQLCRAVSSANQLFTVSLFSLHEWVGESPGQTSSRRQCHLGWFPPSRGGRFLHQKGGSFSAIAVGPDFKVARQTNGMLYSMALWFRLLNALRHGQKFMTSVIGSANTICMATIAASYQQSHGNGKSRLYPALGMCHPTSIVYCDTCTIRKEFYFCTYDYPPLT